MSAGTGMSVLDLSTGAPAELCRQALAVALPGAVVALVIGLALEGLGRSPTQGRDMAGVVWRFVVVLCLLWQYARVFGGLAELLSELGTRIAPTSALDEFALKARAIFVAHVDARDRDGLVATAGHVVGDLVFDGLLNAIILLGEVAFFILLRVGQILLGAFYGLGPLALAASVPKQSAVGGLWFRLYVTYAIWPLVIGALMRLLVATGMQGLTADGAGGGPGGAEGAPVSAFFAALLFLCVAASAPGLASSLVGASANNFVAMGQGVALGHLLKAHHAVGGVAGAVKAFATKATGAVGAAAGGGAGKPNGDGARPRVAVPRGRLR